MDRKFLLFFARSMADQEEIERIAIVFGIQLKMGWIFNVV
jgi:hypothetical protein